LILPRLAFNWIEKTKKCAEKWSTEGYNKIEIENLIVKIDTEVDKYVNES
jgi:hypothetical protein